MYLFGIFVRRRGAQSNLRLRGEENFRQVLGAFNIVPQPSDWKKTEKNGALFLTPLNVCRSSFLNEEDSSILYLVRDRASIKVIPVEGSFLLLFTWFYLETHFSSR